jgi:hypothetical protein
MSTTFWIQFLGTIFGMAMLYFTFVKFKRKELTSLELAGWISCWVVLIAVAIIPSILDFIIEPLNFYRRLDFFVVLGFFLLLSLGFYNYGVMKRIERKITIIVRKDAIRELEKGKAEKRSKASEAGERRNDEAGKGETSQKNEHN